MKNVSIFCCKRIYYRYIHLDMFVCYPITRRTINNEDGNILPGRWAETRRWSTRTRGWRNGAGKEGGGGKERARKNYPRPGLSMRAGPVKNIYGPLGTIPSRKTTQFPRGRPNPISSETSDTYSFAARPDGLFLLCYTFSFRYTGVFPLFSGVFGDRILLGRRRERSSKRHGDKYSVREPRSRETGRDDGPLPKSTRSFNIDRDIIDLSFEERRPSL